MKRTIVLYDKRVVTICVDKVENFKNLFSIEQFSNVCVVTHKNLYEIYRQKIKSVTKNIIFLPEGEKTKSVKYLLFLYKEFLNKKLDRKSLVIVIGGGVIGDVVGFACATYMRGINYVQIPTTLLAMVDSSIGGKTAVDLKEGKNLVGSFYQPSMILYDFDFLSTLPQKEIFNGFGEIVKYAVINKKIFNLLTSVDKDKLITVPFPINSFTKKLILECVDTKLKIVKKDEKEISGEREKLNFGHTIAHAIESATGYRYYTHGESVFLGILAESYISYKLNLLEYKEYQKIVNLVNKFANNHLFDTKLLSIPDNKIFYHIKFDKKMRKNNYRLTLPLSIGKVQTVEFVPPKLIKQSIKFLKQWISNSLRLKIKKFSSYNKN